MGKLWNLWHGCHKYSEGCKFCYVHRGDERYGRDQSIIYKTKQFDLPIQKNKKGDYKIPSGEQIYLCFTSDFLLEEADEWRKEAWKMIEERTDLHFLFITKRIERFFVSLPENWGKGYNHVTVCCTCENQKQVDLRLPIFKSLPIKHKVFIHEPLLEKIYILPYLDDSIEQVVVGGESGIEARICDFDWINSIRDQCLSKNVSFHFKQTGSHFVKNGKLYYVPRKEQHRQAKKAAINYLGKHDSYL